MTTASVGQQLRQARTELQLNLKDVTQATKIQPWVLEALEGDRLHTTMSPIYVKSFLATYSKFLRLDPTPFVAQLFPPPPPSVQQELAAVSPKRVRATKTETRPVPVKQAAPAPSPRPPRPAFVMPDLSWLADLTDRAMPALRRLAALAALVGVAAGLVAINPLRGLAPRRKEASVTTLAPKKTAAAPKEIRLNLQPTVPLELALVANKPTWISVKSDGQLVAQERLTAGTKESWKARQRFELIIAEPAQVDATLNGQPITPLTLAHKGRVVITHTAIKPLAATAPAPAQEPRKDAAATAIAKPAQTASAPATVKPADAASPTTTSKPTATATSAPAAKRKPTTSR
jgi:hypothetical protein